MGHGRDTSPKPFAVVAVFTNPEALLAGAKKAKAEGYNDIDAYSPIPVEGLLDVIEWKDDRLAWLVFLGGLAGLVAGFGLEWWSSTQAYAHNVGGKPYGTIQMFLPVYYECTILLAAFAATFGMFALNGLPKPHHPIFNAKAGSRASQDRFLLCIESTDAQFDKDRTVSFMETMGAESVEYVETSEGY